MNKQVLQLRFKDAEGKIRTMSIANAKPGLKENTLRQAMTDIADTDLFVQNGVDLYKTLVSASYVSTTTNEIFKA